MFKSLAEIKRIKIILESNTDRFLKFTNVACRFFYMLYYVLDNMYIFSRVCNLHAHYPRLFPIYSLRKLARLFWLFGLSLFIIICCKIIRKTYTDESDLKVAALNKMTVKSVMENLEIICKLRHDYWLNFARALLDFFICVNDLDIPFRLLGKRLSPGFEGFFGMSASVIYLYTLRRVMHT